MSIVLAQFMKYDLTFTAPFAVFFSIHIVGYECVSITMEKEFQRCFCSNVLVTMYVSVCNLQFIFNALV